VTFEEDNVEGSSRRGPKALVVLLSILVRNRLKSVVPNLRLLLVGSPLETVGSSLNIVEETITSSYSKGLLLYYRKSSLV
jgi:hypothetical protein